MIKIKLILAIVFCLFIVEKNALSKELFKHPLDNMPIMKELPRDYHGSSPHEQRDAKFRVFLSASVKIQVGNGSGSGTIIYYDEKNNLAYVASCGHLWNKGSMSEEQAKAKNVRCEIVTWYKNQVKLEKPESFEAKMLFYSYTDDIDTSLLVFSPDWKPTYFPIAPVDYEYKFGSIAHSCGCDGGKEVAHYEVKLLELNGDLVTIENSPRPGRSGGGLLDEEMYIGTCWGTEYIDGSGMGFFTPIKDIHHFWGKQKSYNFLLNKKPNNIKGKLIPIFDRKSNKRSYDQNYILVP
jgi:hypothetical protein